MAHLRIGDGVKALLLRNGWDDTPQNRAKAKKILLDLATPLPGHPYANRANLRRPYPPPRGR